MNELSLFSGAGGALLASKLLGWRTIGYVEFNDYCQRVLRARIDDGILDEAPIFTDVCEFLESGAAREYRGFADVVTGGFPCQDISVAGSGAGIEGERSGLWKTMAGIIREVRPEYAFVENSPALTSRGLGTVLGDLAEMGFNAKWGVLGANDVGAPHIRKRIWIVAHARRKYGKKGYSTNMVAEKKKRSQGAIHHKSGCEGQNVAYPNSAQREGRGFPLGTQKEYANIGSAGWWEVEPDVGRVADGVAHGVDRLKAIGNGQVPACASVVWELLS